MFLVPNWAFLLHSVGSSAWLGPLILKADLIKVSIEWLEICRGAFNCARGVVPIPDFDLPAHFLGVEPVADALLVS